MSNQNADLLSPIDENPNHVDADPPENVTKIKFKYKWKKFIGNRSNNKIVE